MIKMGNLNNSKLSLEFCSLAVKVLQNLPQFHALYYFAHTFTQTFLHLDASLESWQLFNCFQLKTFTFQTMNLINNWCFYELTLCSMLTNFFFSSEFRHKRQGWSNSFSAWNWADIELKLLFIFDSFLAHFLMNFKLSFSWILAEFQFSFSFWFVAKLS